MRQLHVLGVSDDGDTLLLGTSAQGKVTHRVALDGRLRQAVRGQLAAPGSDRVESVLSPKEIQARLRAGATPDEVAKIARVPVARVLPYFAPVEAERERIVEEARRAVLHRNRAPHPTQPLGEAVDARLREVAGLKDDSVVWTARRRADGAWVVRLTYSARGGQRRAEWLWQPVSRELSALDSSGTRLAAEVAATPKRRPVRRPVAKKAAPRKSGARTGGARKAAAKKASTPLRRPAATKAAPSAKPAAAKKSRVAAPKKAAAPVRKQAAAPARKQPAAAIRKQAAGPARKQPAVATRKAAAPAPLPRVAKTAPRRRKAVAEPPVRTRVLEVVPDPVPIPVPIEALPAAAPAAETAAAAAPARRPGTRVPVPSWSDVLLGVTGPAAAAAPEREDPEPQATAPATPRSSTGGRRRRT